MRASQSAGGLPASEEWRGKAAFQGRFDTLPETLSYARRFAPGGSASPSPPAASSSTSMALGAAS